MTGPGTSISEHLADGRRIHHHLRHSVCVHFDGQTLGNDAAEVVFFFSLFSGISFYSVAFAIMGLLQKYSRACAECDSARVSWFPQEGATFSAKDGY